MKIANYNIEWMNGLFKEARPLFSDEWSARHNITKSQQLTAIAKVMRIVDADMIMILEAPNEYEKGATARALENFAAYFNLRQNRALIGTPSGTDQEIAALYDPTTLSINVRPHQGPNPPKFTEHITLDGPNLAGKYQFSKPPLELDITYLPSNFQFKLIGAHFKSKAPHGAKNEKDARRIALLNRQKQIAQALWMRDVVAEIRDPLVVCGDFNDGPGYDAFEQRLGKSTIDILTEGGLLFDPVINALPSTTSARFFNREDHSFKEALIDFSFVNPIMRPRIENWEIWHPYQNTRLQKIPDWQEALLTASDHFPICITVK